MGAFHSSIEMGYRCRGWLVSADAPADPMQRVVRGTRTVCGQQWIRDAADDARREQVEKFSQVVLDGGPRWVLSTALGFLTGGICWTVVYATLFAVANFMMYINTPNPSWTSGAELGGVIAYTILAVAISVASVPGRHRVSEWKSLAAGLVVEMLLCVCVIVSVAIIHDIFSSAVDDSAGLSTYAELGHMAAPAFLWMAASQSREKAVEAVQTKLSSFWCHHPTVACPAKLDKHEMDSLWDKWSKSVRECARRVGGHSMLGFSDELLEMLSASSPTPDALQEVEHMRSGLHKGGSMKEPWLRHSLAFFEGYKNRLRVGGPASSSRVLARNDVQALVRSLASDSPDNHDVNSYKSEIEGSPEKGQYNVIEDERWYFAGALVADSDSRARPEGVPEGSSGSRLAVAISIIAKGTDPLARLKCYPDDGMTGSPYGLLKWAMHTSVKELVSELADSANVADVDGLGNRGLAYVEADNILSYSPDEMVAASRTEEVFVTTHETFSGSSDMDTFEKLWGGSEDIRRRVDVSDMVPPNADARLGWMCHVGFTVAILTLHWCGGGSRAFVVLLLVAIPATNERVSPHVDGHFFMIYVRCILNYARLLSWWASPASRGQDAIHKSNNARYIVFLLVNILPVAACYVLEGDGTATGGSEWAWWLAFTPCLLASLPGLLYTLTSRWVHAFKYKWLSWHVPNRWFSGYGYLGVVELRERVGKNVLSVVSTVYDMRVEHVTPKRGGVESTGRFVVVGGGRLPEVCC